jgi:hypothetical protein
MLRLVFGRRHRSLGCCLESNVLFSIYIELVLARSHFAPQLSRSSTAQYFIKQNLYQINTAFTPPAIEHTQAQNTMQQVPYKPPGQGGDDGEKCLHSMHEELQFA